MNAQGEVLYRGATVADGLASTDWAAVRGAGLDGVYLRASAGCAGLGEAFETARREAARAGLEVGAYHVLTAQSVAQARTQARAFLKQTWDTALTWRPAARCAPWPGADLSAVNEVAEAFLETVEYAGGVSPILYTEAGDAARLWRRSLAERWPLWIVDDGADAPRADGAPWPGWTGWEYTDTATVPGLPGAARLSRFTGGIAAASLDVCDDAETPAPPESVPAPEGKLICLTALYGDTLSGIARLFGTTAEAVARTSGIADPDRLFPGERLYLRVNAQIPVARCERYEVRRGDTLSGIARRLGFTTEALARLNDLPDPDRLTVGQALKLPE